MNILMMKHRLTFRKIIEFTHTSYKITFKLDIYVFVLGKEATTMRTCDFASTETPTCYKAI